MSTLTRHASQTKSNTPATPAKTTLEPRALSNQAIWRRPILISTAAALPTLWTQVLAQGIEPVGFLCVDDSVFRDESPRHLGTIDALATRHAIDPFTAAVVSLPSSASPTILKVRTLLRSCGIVERFIPPFSDLLDA